MDFNFSDEQRQLKDSVERFVRDQYAFDKWRKTVTTEEGYREENWRQIAELGWLGVAVPEAYGGLGGNAVDTAVIMEGLGRGLVAEPYFSTAVLGGGFLCHGGSQAQKEALLPALAEGKLKLAFAFAEHQARFNLADVAVSAKKNGGGYVISGQKCVVFDAVAADRLVVSARTAGAAADAKGISLFLVDRKAKGLSVKGYRTVDHRRAADVGFDQVAVGADALIGKADEALALIELVADHAISALAAEAVGCMQVLCDTTNEYLKTRKQFGRPIGQFQVLQHRMVEMWIALEQARSMNYMLAMKVAEPAPERAKSAAAAKTTIGQSGRFVGQQAVQLHGGMGMSDELNVGHYMKRLMMIDLMFGNADHHRKRFAEMG
jgi:alkylation response protein AidB-like acyl-CoA dehydrogenase